MEIKYRTIRMGGSKGSRFMIDEYGIVDGEIFHRYVVISRDVYDVFQENPDNDMHLSTFLKRNDIDSQWKPVGKDGIGNFSKLLQDKDLQDIQSEVAESSEEAKKTAYKKVYDALSEKETLITDPLIMNVFNEAIRDDSDLADWESVFPFFR